MSATTRNMLIAFAALIIVGGALVLTDNVSAPAPGTSPDEETNGSASGSIEKTPSTGGGSSVQRGGQSSNVTDVPTGDVVVVARDLEIPWDIAFLPGGDMLVTERTGQLLQISQNGSRTTLLENLGTHRGEGGLLGITLHPNFASNGFVYLYLTDMVGGRIENRIERYRLSGTSLLERTVILDGIPGASYHDGGRIAFGPDGMLYATVGDATKQNEAQDPQTLHGSILRMRPNGSVPADNPFGNYVYSYGHRNPQGIAWDDAGRLWSTEHGRSGVLSGLDEINLIDQGANYGWPVIQGDETMDGMRSPAWHSGPFNTWAPASALYYRGSLFFGGLRGEALYEATLDGPRVTGLRSHFKGEFGRIRTVRLGPDGYFYLTTSNTDGRGDRRDGDDKIIRIDPDAL